MKIFYSLLFIFFSLTLSAKIPLSWEQAVTMAENSNAELKSAHSNLNASEFQLGIPRSTFLPQLSFDLSYDRKDQTTNTLNSSYDLFSSSLNLNQNLFAGFQDIEKIKQAKLNIKISQAQLQSTKAQISFNLKNAFENFTYAKDYLELTEEIIRRREGNLSLVELSFKSGRENKGSFFLSQAYLEQAKYDNLQAKNALRISLAKLGQALGIDNSSEYDIQGNIPTQEPDQLPLFTDIAKNTPEYQKSLWQEEFAKAQITIARSAFFPSLDLTGSLTRSDQNFYPNQDRYWSMGLNISLPFFSGGKDYFTTKSAVQNWSASENQKINLSRQIISQLEQVYATYLEAVAKFKVDSSFKQAATARAEISRTRYNNGLLTFEDWDVIENDLISRQKNYLLSKRDRVITEAGWEQVQGKGVF
ncbi:MAG: TolC family protein [Bacteriovoracaceae bacterium]|nr:TolC family protein [Bacteriovoracaceae bacterium]